MVLAHHETVLTGFAFTQNDLGDTRFVNYVLEHGYRWLAGWKGNESFWSPPVFYPARNVAAYSDVMLGAAPFYWLWRILGAAPDTAFQLWVLTITALNFAAAYVFLRRAIGATSPAASFGAALFAAAGSRINQTLHFQLFPHFWSILGVLALARLFQSRGPGHAATRIRWIWVFTLSAAMQLWAGFYLGWFFGLGLAAAFAWAMVFRSHRLAVLEILRGHPYTWSLSVAAAVAALAPMATHFFAASREVGIRSFDEALTMIPRLPAWLYMGPFSWLYGGLAHQPFFRGIPMEHEQRIGFGLSTTVLCLAGLWLSRRDPICRLIALSGVTLFLLSTLFGPFTLWRWVYQLVPGAKAIRAVSRIGIVLLIPMSVGLARALSEISRRGPAFTAGAILAGAFCLVEQGETTPAFDKQQNRDDIAAIAARLGPRCNVFLYSPVAGFAPYWKYQIDAMWAQLETGVPTLNGYSGNDPPGWALTDPSIRVPGDEEKVRQAMMSWVERNHLDPSTLCWLRLPVQEGVLVRPALAASVVLQRVPSQMVAGQRYPVEITVTNQGSAPWRRAERVRLGAQSPQDNTIWGTARVELSEDVSPGGTAVFHFDATAPGTPGRRTFQWQMVQDGVDWFGMRTPPVEIQVVAAH